MCKKDQKITREALGKRNGKKPGAVNTGNDNLRTPKVTSVKEGAKKGERRYDQV